MTELRWLADFVLEATPVAGKREGGTYKVDEKGVAEYDDKFIREVDGVAFPFSRRPTLALSDPHTQEELERCKDNLSLKGGPVPNYLARIVMYKGRPVYLPKLKPNLPWVFNLMPTDPHHKENLTIEQYSKMKLSDLKTLTPECNWSLSKYRDSQLVEELIPDLYEDVVRIGTDYGIIVFVRNPLNPERKILWNAGCHGPGTTMTGAIIRNAREIMGEELIGAEEVLTRIYRETMGKYHFQAVVEGKVKAGIPMQVYLYDIVILE